MSQVLSVGDLAVSDPLDSLFENLRPVPRIEVTDGGVRFVQFGSISSYNSINDALNSNQDFSGVIRLNCDWDEGSLQPHAGTSGQRSFKFDLNRFTLSVSEGLIDLGNSNATFTNGTMVSRGILLSCAQSQNPGYLRLDNIQLDVVDGQGIKVYGGTLHVDSGSRIHPCSEDGGFNRGIQLSGDSKIVVEDQTLIQNDFGSCIFLVENGEKFPTAEINGGSIIGSTGLYVMGGEVKIPYYSNVVILGTGNESFYSRPLKSGHAIVVRPSSSSSNIEFDVYSGKFIGINKAPVGSYSNSGVDRMTKFMNGGMLDRFPSSISSDPDYDILAEGCYGQSPCRIMRNV